MFRPNLVFFRFIVIPSCVYELVSLEILLARDNKIEQIHATESGLAALPRLATLDLANNNIEQVPPILGKLTKIMWVPRLYLYYLNEIAI